MISNTDIQRIRDTPIEQVADAVGLSVNRHRSLCPFHDDTTPSLTFNRSKNTYRCFVCGAHGGPIDLVMNKLDKSFVDACRWLAADNHITLSEERRNSNPECYYSKDVSRPSSHASTFDASRYLRFFERPWLNEAAIRFLYTQRHIDPRVVQWCRLTSYRDKNGTNWLQIPYYNQDGILTGVQSRNLDYRKLSGTMEPGTWNSRFRFPKGSVCHIYNLQVLQLLKEGEPLFITEGCSDCWSMLSSGHKAVAIPSATLLKPEDLKPLETCRMKLGTTFHMYPDQDAPGARLFLDLKEWVETPSSLNPHPSTLIHHQLPEGCKDFSDYYISKFKKQ